MSPVPGHAAVALCQAQYYTKKSAQRARCALEPTRAGQHKGYKQQSGKRAKDLEFLETFQGIVGSRNAIGKFPKTKKS